MRHGGWSSTQHPSVLQSLPSLNSQVKKKAYLVDDMRHRPVDVSRERTHTDTSSQTHTLSNWRECESSLVAYRKVETEIGDRISKFVTTSTRLSRLRLWFASIHKKLRASRWGLAGWARGLPCQADQSELYYWRCLLESKSRWNQPCDVLFWRAPSYLVALIGVLRDEVARASIPRGRRTRATPRYTPTLAFVAHPLCVHVARGVGTRTCLSTTGLFNVTARASSPTHNIRMSIVHT